MPLKNIPYILSPDMLKVLCEMGHGDTIDRNPSLLSQSLRNVNGLNQGSPVRRQITPQLGQVGSTPEVVTCSDLAQGSYALANIANGVVWTIGSANRKLVFVASRPILQKNIVENSFDATSFSESWQMRTFQRVLFARRLVLQNYEWMSTVGMKYGADKGHCIPALLTAVLTLFPLDTYILAPVSLMQVVPDDMGKVVPTIWDCYKDIIKKFEPGAGVQMMERFSFYDAAKRAYAIVHTGDGFCDFSETSQYGNIILQKGVVLPDKIPSLAMPTL